MSWQCDGCDQANRDCYVAGRCVAFEEFGPGGFDGRALVDALHPKGRCTCWGEGRCAYCMDQAGLIPDHFRATADDHWQHVEACTNALCFCLDEDDPDPICERCSAPGWACACPELTEDHP